MRTLFLTFVLTIPVFTLGQNLGTPPPKPTPTPSTRPTRKSVPRSVNVEITGKKMTIGGEKITLPVSRRVLFRILGDPTVITPADKSFRGSNTIYTWDDYGIYAYEDPARKLIGSIDIQLNTDNSLYNFSPVSAFTGKLKIDGTAVTTDSTVEQINVAKTGKPFSEYLTSPKAVFRIEYDSLAMGLVWEKAKENGRPPHLLYIYIYEPASRTEAAFQNWTKVSRVSLTGVLEKKRRPRLSALSRK